MNKETDEGKKINWQKVSKSKEAIGLIIQRNKIEEKIKSIDPHALINYELEIL